MGWIDDQQAARLGLDAQTVELHRRCVGVDLHVDALLTQRFFGVDLREEHAAGALRFRSTQLRAPLPPPPTLSAGAFAPVAALPPPTSSPAAAAEDTRRREWRWKSVAVLEARALGVHPAVITRAQAAAQLRAAAAKAAVGGTSSAHGADVTDDEEEEAQEAS